MIRQFHGRSKQVTAVTALPGSIPRSSATSRALSRPAAPPRSLILLRLAVAPFTWASVEILLALPHAPM
jgi:hypothetical protein